MGRVLPVALQWNVGFCDMGQTRAAFVPVTRSLRQEAIVLHRTPEWRFCVRVRNEGAVASLVEGRGRSASHQRHDAALLVRIRSHGAMLDQGNQTFPRRALWMGGERTPAGSSLVEHARSLAHCSRFL